MTTVCKKEFESILDSYVKNAASFEVHKTSCYSKIIHKDTKIIHIDNMLIGKGVHIITLVKRNIVQRLADGLVSLPEHGFGNFKYRSYNPEQIDANVGCVVKGLDIEGCYFNTLFKLRYIDEDTYQRSTKNPDWKKGRNASIGSLDKKVNVQQYELGKMVLQKPVEDPLGLKVIREHVISHVWNMFSKFNKDFPNSSLMYLTDCVYIDSNKEGIVKDFYHENGYVLHEKEIYLESFQKSNHCDTINRKACSIAFWTIQYIVSL